MFVCTIYNRAQQRAPGGPGHHDYCSERDGEDRAKVPRAEDSQGSKNRNLRGSIVFSEETAIRQMIDGITDCLSSMTKEERLAWFRKSQYPHPINFQKEIDGTVYTVNTHFNAASKESIKEKAERILQKP